MRDEQEIIGSELSKQNQLLREKLDTAIDIMWCWAEGIESREERAKEFLAECKEEIADF